MVRSAPLLGLLLAVPAVAFEANATREGATVAWDRMPVRWAYDDAGRPAYIPADAAHDAIREAFATWNTVPGARVRFIEVEAPAQADNVVYWDPDWDWTAEMMAMTSTWTLPDGELDAFTVALNAEHTRWSVNGDPNAMDLQNAMAHEVGHALGLGHDPDEAAATMAPTASAGEIRKRDLHASDEEGARFLYPGGQDPAGCRSAPALPAWSLTLGGLLLVLRRRR